MIFVLFIGGASTPKASAAAGIRELRDFEDQAVGTVLFDQYDGVIFVGGNSTNYDGSRTVTIVQPAVGTATPTRGVRMEFKSLFCEFGCSSFADIAFDLLQSRVSLSTGLASSPGEFATMALEALAADGSVLTRSVGPCLGGHPTAVTTPLEVIDAAGRIDSVRLQLVSCFSPYDPVLTTDVQPLVIDNLSYDRPQIPRALDTSDPLVLIKSPMNGETVTGTVPGLTLVWVEAEITESSLATVMVQVNGMPPKQLPYTCSAPSACKTLAILRDTDGLVAGSNSVTISAYDFAGNLGTGLTAFEFVVRPIPPPSTVDIFPSAFQVTQGIDYGPVPLDSRFLAPDGSSQADGPIPLVGGKPTLVRIYGGAAGTTTPLTDVPARMHVQRIDCTPYPCDFATSMPPTIANNGVPNLKGITVPAVGAPALVPDTVVANIAQTWTFFLPSSWCYGKVRLTIDVNNGGFSSHSPPLPNQPKQPECSSCTPNNTLQLTLAFDPPNTISVHPVYIHLTGTHTRGTCAKDRDCTGLGILSPFYPGVCVSGTCSYAYNDFVPSPSGFYGPFDLLNRSFPLKVRPESPRDLTIDPGTTTSGDLNGLIRDNFDSQDDSEFFVGVVGDVPALVYEDGAGNVNKGGAGAVGARGAWVQADYPNALRHEIGHNIGFSHASVCHDEGGGWKEFPIPHGAAGVIQTNLDNRLVALPGQPLSDCSTKDDYPHDFMSYGPRSAMSWYSYRHLSEDFLIKSYKRESKYEKQDGTSVSPAAPHPSSVSAAAAPLVDGLLMRASVQSDGAVELLPAYQVQVPGPIVDTADESAIVDADNPDLRRTFEVYDGVGNIIAVHNFDLTLVGEGDGEMTISEVIPLMPSMAGVRLLHGTEILADVARVVGGPVGMTITAPAANSTWAAGGQEVVSWGASSPVPLVAQVEYSSDGGLTYEVLRRDVPTGSLEVDTDWLRGTASAFIRVQVSDGLNTASAVQGPIQVDTKPPVAHIDSPLKSRFVTAGVDVGFEGSATDADGEVLDDQLTWQSDRDGILGQGSQIATALLSLGRHVITLTASDQQGEVGSATAEFHVFAPGTEHFALVPPDAAAAGCAAKQMHAATKLLNRIRVCKAKDRKDPVAGGTALAECTSLAEAKFEKGLRRLKGCVPCATSVSSEIRQQVSAFATNLSDIAFAATQPGSAAATKCENALLKSATKLEATTSKCVLKAIAARLKGVPFDLATCDSTARQTFMERVASLSDAPDCPVYVLANRDAVPDLVQKFADVVLGGLIYCDGSEPLDDLSKRVFLAIPSVAGDLGGLDGADAICASRAAAAQLSGTYKAWLSDDSTSAASRLSPSLAPYRLVTGAQVADNWLDLTDGTLDVPIDVDSFGIGPYMNDVIPFTGSTETGQSIAGQNCNNWTTAAPLVNAACGRLGTTGQEWSNGGLCSCGVLRPLYCIEQ